MEKIYKKAIIENGVRKEYENVEDLTNNYICLKLIFFIGNSSLRKLILVAFYNSFLL